MYNQEHINKCVPTNVYMYVLNMAILHMRESLLCDHSNYKLLRPKVFIAYVAIDHLFIMTTVGQPKVSVHVQDKVLPRLVY